jgi:ATPase subunit of ABC transporter with duplicated ATPase domains
MHSIRLGLLTRANGLLFKCLTVDQKAELDIMARRFNEAHRQSVRTSFPRALFVKGITTLSQLSVGERVGVTMTLVCVMQQNDDWTLMSEALKDRDLDAANVLQFLECVSVMPLQRHVLIHPFECSCQWCKNVCLVCKAMD